MRVCFFLHYSYTYQDGATLSLLNIADEMVERGVKVTIILPHKNRDLPIQNDKIQYYIVPSFSMRVPINQKGIISFLKGRVKTLLNYFSMRRAIKILKKDKPNIIHINGIDSDIGARVAQKLDIPYVWHIRQFLEEDLDLRVYNEKNINKLLRKANAVIGISQTIIDKYQEKLKRDIKLIYNGIPIEKYKLKKTERFKNKIVRILIAGRIVEKKGQYDAVRAIGHLVNSGIKNIHLTIVGNRQHQHYVNKITEYINRNNLNKYIEIIDHVSDLRTIRKNCDIGLICSKKEAFGRVTIETMLSSMLVIGSNTGGTAEIIKNNVTGLLYNEGDYLDLANRIKYAIDEKEKMNTIIENGYNLVLDKYSITNVVNQILKLYKEIENNS